jgi:Fe-S-cluster formation regulator IscX/YfhJ
MHRAAIAVVAIGVLGWVADRAQAVPRYSARYEEKCALCHVNPSGGGMRTLYASQYLVPEELAWSKPSSHILESIDPEIAKHIQIGTDFRTLYTYSDDPNAQTEDFFQMQGDVYLNFQMDDALSLYYDQGITSSYELFGLWQGLPLTSYVKVGRFVPAYGWKFDDHTMYVREALGFFPPTNSDVGIEFGLSPGRLDMQLSVVNGNRGGTFDDNQKLAAVFTGVAAGYWEDGEAANFGSGGPYGYLTWKRLAWLGELDWFLDDPQGDGHTTGLVTSNEFSYLIRQGLELKATYDFLDPDWNTQTGSQSRVGGGVFALAKPFVAVEALYRRTRFDDGVALSGEDFWEAILQLHLLY